MLFTHCAACPIRQAVFRYWQQRLKVQGFATVSLAERYWDAVAQKTRKVLSIETNLAHLDSPDTDRLLPSVNPFEVPEPSFDELIAALPPNIADILRLDHRRRTRQQKARLAAWLEDDRQRLVRRFGFM